MIAIVSHDAGGAELLSSWLRQNPQPNLLVLAGPAVNIFQRKLGKLNLCSLESAIDLCDWVLCGTSWASDLEKEAIVYAKAAKKKVVSFLDHWVNYFERFQMGDLTLFPDEIWVGDIAAQKIAQKIFPKIEIKLISNPYFRELEVELQKIRPIKNNITMNSVLYVCEPIREHALRAYGDERYWGYTEEDALNYFLKNINLLGVNISSIKIRPHPSESKNKYQWAMEKNKLVVETHSDNSLVEQIADADIVVGCGSMALVVALLAKKRVLSSVPPGAELCKLPQPEIEHLQILEKIYKKDSDG
jgi:hypothetical protein